MKVSQVRYLFIKLFKVVLIYNPAISVLSQPTVQPFYSDRDRYRGKENPGPKGAGQLYFGRPNRISNHRMISGSKKTQIIG